MKINEVFPSAYLKASDLKGGQRTVVIDDCKTQEIGQGDDVKQMPVLEFRNGAGALVCNKTNWNTLYASFGGEDTDEWRGRSITLFVAQVNFRGELVDGIRILIPEQNAQKEATPETMNLDEEVPF